MRSLSHLADHVLLRELRTLLARERAATAALLVHLAEVDSRRLYLQAAHPSMHEYCVRVLHMSEHAAFKRIRAARAARRLPRILDMLGSGRLHLSGVVLLAPRLTRANADELLDASAYKTKSEIELLLAQRFPGLDVPTSVRELPAPAPPTAAPLAPGPVDSPGVEEDLVAALRQLGFRPQEARRGLELSASEAGAPLETRLRMALRGLGRARFERCTHGAPHTG